MGQIISIEEMHHSAKQRFALSPGKCYQRHIRELYGEVEERERISSLDGARVEHISRAEAESVILKYEWLGTMAQATRACYGLKLNGELLGVACFAAMGGPVRNICGERHAGKAVCLARGACVPHAPKNAASYLVPRACRQGWLDFGWQIFFAYSDADAGEIGQIYQAVNWSYLGEGIGRVEGSFHVDWISPDGTRTVTSNVLNHDRQKKFFRSVGWDKKSGDPREYIAYLGWKPVRRPGKKKWVWFEGTSAQRTELKSLCRYPFRPYPKRIGSQSVEPIT